MKGRRLWLGVGASAAALLLLWLLLGRSSGRFRGATGDANVLLITVDTLRADRLGCYGNRGIRTPVIDGLADDGVLFESAVTPAVMTLPSHASILSGLYPPTHGIRDNGDYRLDSDVLTLAEVLKSRGARTGAVVGSFVLDSMFGLDQGFDVYDDALPARGLNDSFLAERPAGAVTDAALRLLASMQGARFFLWVHYFDPHHPYTAPRAFREQYPRRGYDAEIAYTDAEIGRLLGSLSSSGVRDKTLVVLVGDHGEGLDDHGERTHGIFLYDEQVRVPLIVSFPPHVPSRVRVRSTARTVDVMPTILDLVRLDPAGTAHEVQGASLWPLIAQPEKAEARPAYLEAMSPLLMYGWSPLFGIREARWKYVEAPRPELYDLAADPGERSNLVAARPDLAARYREALAALRREVTRPGTEASPIAPDPETESKLRSLGYAAAPGGAPAGGPGASAQQRPDPKDRVPELARINDVYIAFGAGQYAAAAREAAGLLSTNPDNHSVRFYLAGALMRMGRHAEALEQYQVLLRRDANDTEALCNLGWCLINMNRLEEAADTFRRVLEIHEGHIYAMASLANVAFVKGEYREAASLYRQVLQKEPSHTSSILTMAIIAEQSSAFEEASVFYARALEVDPANLDALMGLGWIRFRQGRHEEALKLLEQARDVAPQASEVALAMGDVLLSMGRHAEARVAYEVGLEGAPQAASGWYGLGAVELQAGDASRAVQHFERAVALNPARPAWREELARALAKSGRYAAAASELERYLASGRVPADRLQALREEAAGYRRRGG